MFGCLCLLGQGATLSLSRRVFGYGNGWEQVLVDDGHKPGELAWAGLLEILYPNTARACRTI